jgi:hypothetical protein
MALPQGRWIRPVLAGTRNPRQGGRAATSAAAPPAHAQPSRDLGGAWSESMRAPPLTGDGRRRLPEMGLPLAGMGATGSRPRGSGLRTGRFLGSIPSLIDQLDKARVERSFLAGWERQRLMK